VISNKKRSIILLKHMY